MAVDLNNNSNKTIPEEIGAIKTDIDENGKDLQINEENAMYDDEGNEYKCKICHDTSTVDNLLLNPCRCKGSLKYIHNECLSNWIKDTMAPVCEICRYKYKFKKIFKSNTPNTLPYRILFYDLLKTMVEGLKMGFYISMFLLKILFSLILNIRALNNLTFKNFQTKVDERFVFTPFNILFIDFTLSIFMILFNYFFYIIYKKIKRILEYSNQIRVRTSVMGNGDGVNNNTIFTGNIAGGDFLSYRNNDSTLFTLPETTIMTAHNQSQNARSLGHEATNSNNELLNSIESVSNNLDEENMAISMFYDANCFFFEPFDITMNFHFFIGTSFFACIIISCQLGLFPFLKLLSLLNIQKAFYAIFLKLMKEASSVSHENIYQNVLRRTFPKFSTVGFAALLFLKNLFFSCKSSFSSFDKIKKQLRLIRAFAFSVKELILSLLAYNNFNRLYIFTMAKRFFAIHYIRLYVFIVGYFNYLTHHNLYGFFHGFVNFIIFNSLVLSLLYFIKKRTTIFRIKRTFYYIKAIYLLSILSIFMCFLQGTIIPFLLYRYQNINTSSYSPNEHQEVDIASFLNNKNNMEYGKGLSIGKGHYLFNLNDSFYRVFSVLSHIIFGFVMLHTLKSLVMRFQAVFRPGIYKFDQNDERDMYIIDYFLKISIFRGNIDAFFSVLRNCFIFYNVFVDYPLQNSKRLSNFILNLNINDSLIANEKLKNSYTNSQEIFIWFMLCISLVKNRSKIEKILFDMFDFVFRKLCKILDLENFYYGTRVDRLDFSRVSWCINKNTHKTKRVLKATELKTNKIDPYCMIEDFFEENSRKNASSKRKLELRLDDVQAPSIVRPDFFNNYNIDGNHNNFAVDSHANDGNGNSLETGFGNPVDGCMDTPENDGILNRFINYFFKRNFTAKKLKVISESDRKKYEITNIKFIKYFGRKHNKNLGLFYIPRFSFLKSKFIKFICFLIAKYFHILILTSSRKITDIFYSEYYLKNIIDKRSSYNIMIMVLITFITSITTFNILDSLKFIFLSLFSTIIIPFSISFIALLTNRFMISFTSIFYIISITFNFISWFGSLMLSTTGNNDFMSNINMLLFCSLFTLFTILLFIFNISYYLYFMLRCGIFIFFLRSLTLIINKFLYGNVFETLKDKYFLLERVALEYMSESDVELNSPNNELNNSNNE